VIRATHNQHHLRAPGEPWGAETLRETIMRRRYDFSKAKRGAVVAPVAGKTRITIRLDDDVLAWFKAQVDAAGGGNYQSFDYLHGYQGVLSGGGPKRGERRNNVPREKFVDPVDGMVCDTPEYATQVGLGVDVIEFCGANERIDRSSAFPAII